MKRLAILIFLSASISGCEEPSDCELISAVRDADVDGLKNMLGNRQGRNIGCDNVDIFSVAAVSRDGFDSAKVLIEAGVLPKPVDGEKTTALHEAAMWGDLRMVKLLVENGLNAFSKDYEGATPLDLANERRDKAGVEIAEYLRGLEKGKQGL